LYFSHEVNANLLQDSRPTIANAMPITQERMRGVNNYCRSRIVIGSPANNCLNEILEIVIGIAKKSTSVIRKNMSDGHKVANFVLYLANDEL